MTRHTRVSASSDVYADISINRNRVRKQGKKIYLKDGIEFQIEFNNTSTRTYLARIKVNGNEISSHGLVIRPGEHIYLERYLDSPRKFKFNTYEIPDTRAAAKAIRENGLIEIDFYREAVPDPVRITRHHWPVYDWYVDPDPYKWVYRPSITFDGTSITLDSFSNDNTFESYTSSTARGSSSGTNTVSNATSDVFDVSSQAMHFMEPEAQQRATLRESVSKKETGRVDQGSGSQQNLQTIDMKFEAGIAKSVMFHLLPVSEKKHYTSRDLRDYCKCGRSKKRGWQFCPGCGEELR